jgi:hypothetical protein
VVAGASVVAEVAALSVLPGVPAVVPVLVFVAVVGGGCSRMRWALVPLMPKEEMPARRG